MNLQMPDRTGAVIAAVVGLACIALPYVIPVEHHGGWWESIPGWWALFGGVGCAVIIVVSKTLGKLLLQRPEDWYD